MKDATDLLVKLLKEDHDNGFLDWNGSIPMIPEIFSEANDVTACLFNGLKPFFKDFLSLLSATLGWSAYAGIGAAAMWNNEWDRLKKEGIISALTEKRGIGEMDEYSLDYAGIGFNSREGKEITYRRQEHANGTMMVEIVPLSGNADEFMKQFRECCIAMYRYGVILQMNRMGMK